MQVFPQDQRRILGNEGRGEGEVGIFRARGLSVGNVCHLQAPRHTRSAFMFDRGRRAFGLVKSGNWAAELSRLLLQESQLSLQATQGSVLLAGTPKTPHHRGNYVHKANTAELDSNLAFLVGKMVYLLPDFLDWVGICAVLYMGTQYLLQPPWPPGEMGSK